MVWGGINSIMIIDNSIMIMINSIKSSSTK